jgi:hypothetical protein
MRPWRASSTYLPDASPAEDIVHVGLDGDGVLVDHAGHSIQVLEGVVVVLAGRRVVQDVVSRHAGGKANGIMPAVGLNVGGVIGSAVAGGVFLALLRQLIRARGSRR